MLLISSYKKTSIVIISNLVDDWCFFLDAVSVLDVLIVMSTILIFIISIRVFIISLNSKKQFEQILADLRTNIITAEKVCNINLKKGIVFEKLNRKLLDSLFKINNELILLQKFIIEKRI